MPPKPPLEMPQSQESNPPVDGPQSQEGGTPPDLPQSQEDAFRRCRECSRPAIPNRARCLVCSTREQQRRWRDIDAGRCTTCHSRPALADNRRCLECRDKMRAYFRRTYAKAKAAGKCTYCRHHRRMPHKLVCFGCFQKNAQLDRAARARQRAARENSHVQELLEVESAGDLLHLPDPAPVGQP